ncbi:phosphate transport system regulatory protein PhoU [bacterium]|nr:phosphate transport system regulatory protein PhoU [bacterium]
MSYQLNREIEYLKKVFLSLSTRVEENIHLAFEAFRTLNAETALIVIQNDNEINKEEIDVEEECLKILALHQPVASELRYIISILKINNYLERIGDLAVNVAKKVICIHRENPPAPHINFDFAPLMEKVSWMLKQSLDALVNVDAPLAREVCRADDFVDEQKRAANLAIIAHLKQDPSHCEGLLNILSIARHLERIGDHATNIAEDVIYLVEGSIIRHNPYV